VPLGLGAITTGAASVTNQLGEVPGANPLTAYSTNGIPGVQFQSSAGTINLHATHAQAMVMERAGGRQTVTRAVKTVLGSVAPIGVESSAHILYTVNSVVVPGASAAGSGVSRVGCRFGLMVFALCPTATLVAGVPTRVVAWNLVAYSEVTASNQTPIRVTLSLSPQEAASLSGLMSCVVAYDPAYTAYASDTVADLSVMPSSSQSVSLSAEGRVAVPLDAFYGLFSGPDGYERVATPAEMRRPVLNALTAKPPSDVPSALSLQHGVQSFLPDARLVDEFVAKYGVGLTKFASLADIISGLHGPDAHDAALVSSNIAQLLIQIYAA